VRVVSLLPAATDAVCSLGVAPLLAAVSHECDAPELPDALPRVTRAMVGALVDSAAIDARVRELGDAGEPLFALDGERIAGLAPDVILTQGVCDVCAVSEHDVRALGERLAVAPRIVSLDGSTMEGVFADVARVGEALELRAEAEALLDSLRDRLGRVHLTLKAAQAPRPRVAVIEWTQPIFAAGHWVPDMIRRAGGIDVLAASGDHSTERTVEQVRGADPEVLVVAPCGFDLVRAEREARALLEKSAWSWTAGRAVWALDANRYVSRPGPLLVTGVEALAALLHPGLFGPPDPAVARRVA
jgi:iron complex transport system substrate-binding protein